MGATEAYMGNGEKRSSSGIAHSLSQNAMFQTDTPGRALCGSVKSKAKPLNVPSPPQPSSSQASFWLPFIDLNPQEIIVRQGLWCELSC